MQIIKGISGRGYKDVAEEKRIPVTRIQNYASRAKSISVANYTAICGKKPSVKSARVNGDFFRQMVNVWMQSFNIPRSQFFEELSAKFNVCSYTVCRIVMGFTQSVDRRFEDYMRDKFAASSLSLEQITQSLRRLRRTNSRQGRYSYGSVQPILAYVQVYLGKGPSELLNRSVAYYKSNPEKTLSASRYRYALSLVRRSERALVSGSREDFERLRLKVNKKEGRVPYYIVMPVIDFLKSEGVAVKELLGRSISFYEGSDSYSEWKTVSSERYNIIEDALREHIANEGAHLKKTATETGVGIRALINLLIETGINGRTNYDYLLFNMRRGMSARTPEQLNAGYQIGMPQYNENVLFIPILSDLEYGKLDIKRVQTDFRQAVNQTLEALLPAVKKYISVRCSVKDNQVELYKGTLGDRVVTESFLESYRALLGIDMVGVRKP